MHACMCACACGRRVAVREQVDEALKGAMRLCFIKDVQAASQKGHERSWCSHPSC